jgi:hypothetical protein
MMLVIILATVLLGLVLTLCVGTILVTLSAASEGSSRVVEIRRLRAEGLAAHREDA